MSINLSLHGIVLETFRARKNHEQGKLQSVPVQRAKYDHGQRPEESSEN